MSKEDDQAGPAADVPPAEAVELGESVQVNVAGASLEVGDLVEHVDDPATAGRVVELDRKTVRIEGVANRLPLSKVRRRNV